MTQKIGKKKQNKKMRAGKKLKKKITQKVGEKKLHKKMTRGKKK